MFATRLGTIRNTQESKVYITKTSKKGRKAADVATVVEEEDASKKPAKGKAKAKVPPPSSVAESLVLEVKDGNIVRPKYWLEEVALSNLIRAGDQSKCTFV